MELREFYKLFIQNNRSYRVDVMSHSSGKLLFRNYDGRNKPSVSTKIHNCMVRKVAPYTIINGDGIKNSIDTYIRIYIDETNNELKKILSLEELKINDILVEKATGDEFIIVEKIRIYGVAFAKILSLQNRRTTLQIHNELSRHYALSTKKQHEEE